MSKRLLGPQTVRLIAATAVAASAALIACGSAAAANPITVPAGFQAQVFASGGSLTSPDDITRLGHVVYVVYQNSTKPDGSDGGDSTIVGYRSDGSQAGTWNVTGHADGLTADDERLIVTVNEDAKSSLYTIRPNARPDRQVRHYTYSPDPATLSGGGTDAVSIVNGKILISASNPAPTTSNGTMFAGPAVYEARIPAHGSVASLKPVFYDNSPATDATTGQTAPMNLSDPDSNATVPEVSPRFGGDFMLDSQGDSQLVFAHHPGRHSQSLTLLNLKSAAGTPQVDDVRWSPSQNDTLFAVDATQDVIYEITGPFGGGTVLTAIPAGSPMGGDLGTIDLSSGMVSPFATGFVSPKGLLFVSDRGNHGGQGSDQGRHGHRGHHHD